MTTFYDQLRKEKDCLVCEHYLPAFVDTDRPECDICAGKSQFTEVSGMKKDLRIEFYHLNEECVTA